MKSYLEKNSEVIGMLNFAEELEGISSVLVPAGRGMPKMWEGYRQQKNLIRGCLSTTYFLCETDHEGLLRIFGESNSLVLQGVIYFFWYILDGTPAREVNPDRVDWHKATGLCSIMPAHRNDALRQMEERIRDKL